MDRIHQTTKKIVERVEEQYPYEAIVYENGEKHLNSYPNCYEYHEFPVCETESGDKYVVEKYWLKEEADRYEKIRT